MLTGYSEGIRSEKKRKMDKKLTLTLTLTITLTKTNTKAITLKLTMTKLMGINVFFSAYNYHKIQFTVYGILRSVGAQASKLGDLFTVYSLFILLKVYEIF